MTRVRGQWSLGAAGPLLAREEREDADWRTRGSCNDHDPELWFSDAAADVTRAKAVCAGCPVRERCTEFALEGREAGIWGGLDDAERRALASSRRRRGAPVLRLHRAPAGPRRAEIPDLTEAELAQFLDHCVPGACGTAWAGPWRHSGLAAFRIRRGGGAQIHVSPHRLAWKLATGTDPGTCNVRQECGDLTCMTPACLVTEPAGEGSRRVRRQQAA